jgi:hypothetical protein
MSKLQFFNRLPQFKILSIADYLVYYMYFKTGCKLQIRYADDNGVLLHKNGKWTIEKTCLYKN